VSETTTRHPNHTTPHPDPESAWVAAYALGLAYSSNSQPQQVDLLHEATDGQPELLDLARQRLDTTEVADPDLREAAQHLLHRARTLHLTGSTTTTTDHR